MHTFGSKNALPHLGIGRKASKWRLKYVIQILGGQFGLQVITIKKEGREHNVSPHLMKQNVPSYYFLPAWSYRAKDLVGFRIRSSFLNRVLPGRTSLQIRNKISLQSRKIYIRDIIAIYGYGSTRRVKNINW